MFQTHNVIEDAFLVQSTCIDYHCTHTKCCKVKQDPHGKDHIENKNWSQDCIYFLSLMVGKCTNLW